MITVRATVNLPGLKVGQIAVVDEDAPYVAMCLTRSYVVPLQPSSTSAPAEAPVELDSE